VGVRPVVPGGAQQLFLLCVACGRPQARELEPGTDRATLGCTSCDALELAPLDRCPRCDGSELRWGPFMP